MKFGRSLLMASTATLGLSVTALAQIQGSSSQMAACSEIRNEMEAEVKQSNKKGSWKSQFDELIQQSRQARSTNDCFDTLRRANQLVARETGDQPIGSDRFRKAVSAMLGTTSGNRGTSINSQSQSATITPDSKSEVMFDESAKRVSVAYADEIVGTTAIDSQGDEAGEIEYLVVDTTNGEIKFVILGSGGMLDLGEELAAVPWQKLEVRLNRGQPSVTLTGTAEMVKQGNRLRRDDLDQLTNITYQTQVIKYWVPTTTSDNTGTLERSRSQAGGDKDKANSQATTAQKRQQRSMADNQQEKSGQLRASQTGNDTQTATNENSDNTMMLAGREFVTVLMPSTLKTGRQLRGATVESGDGQELGEIDRLVIDINRGYVAYAIVAQGGFLGIGEDWRPVPLPALTRRSGETYSLSASVDALQSRPRLTSSDLPDRVRTADLRKLYDAYQAQPYWTSNQSSDRDRAAAGEASSGQQKNPRR